MHHVQNPCDEEAMLEVTHYLCCGWLGDHGTPVNKYSILSLIKRIRKDHFPSGPPLLVHCSSGVGGTGTFIALDAMLLKLKMQEEIDINDFVKRMRTNRTLMVHTKVHAQQACHCIPCAHVCVAKVMCMHLVL